MPGDSRSIMSWNDLLNATMMNHGITSSAQIDDSKCRRDRDQITSALTMNEVSQ